MNRFLGAFMALMMVTPVLLKPAQVAAEEPAPQYSVSPVRGVSTPGLPPARPDLADPATIQVAPYLSPIPRGAASAPPAGQAVIEDPSGGTAPGPQAPSLVTSFDGMDNATNISVTGLSLEPPDPMIAVGPDHVVQTQNLTIRISTKAGVTVSTSALATLLQVPGSINKLADPKIVYDPVSARFFLVLVGFSSGVNQGMEFIAVSTTSNPTQSWHVYHFTDTGYFPDFPGLAVGSDKVVVSANAYALPGPGAFQGAQIRVLEKSDMVSGLGVHQTLFSPNPSYFTRQPAQPLTASATVYLASLTPTSPSTTLNIFKLTGSVAAQTVAISSTALAIAGASVPPDAEQLGGGTVTTNDTRLLGAVWRNQRLHTFTNAACLFSGDSVTRSCLKFFEVDTSAALPTLVEEPNYGASGAYYYFPALTFDGAGNKYVVFTRSSSIEYASVRHTGQLAGVTGLQGSAQLKAGEANYGGKRWGDYHGAAPDPAVPGCVWVTGEYAKGGGALWGTAIGQLNFSGSCGSTGDSPTKLGFTQQPTGAVVNATLGAQPKVAVQDASGATVTAATDAVKLDITEGTGAIGAALTCTNTNNTAATVAGIATFDGCKIDKPGVYTLTATSGTLTAAISASFAVTAAGAVQLRLEPDPAQATAGAAATDVRIIADTGTQPLDVISVRVTFDPAKLQADDGDTAAVGVQAVPGTALSQVLTNTIDNATGQVNYAAGRPAGSPAPSGTLTLGTLKLRGLAEGSWPLQFDAAGIEAAFNGEPLTVTSQNGTVRVTILRLAFTAQPVRSASGQDFGLQPVVTVLNAQGAVVTSDSSTPITLRLAAGGIAGAALTCDPLTRQVAAGVASFSGCKIDRTGASYVLEATAPGFADAQSAPFNITFAGDADGDCRVGAVDYSLVVTHFGKNAASADWTAADRRAFRADLNGDGSITATDFSLMVSRFGNSTAPCAPASNLATVVITGSAFQPVALTVSAGAAVVWLNRDTIAHTVTGDNGQWGSGVLPPGGSYVFRHTASGAFAYHCSIHPAMTGTVTVQ